MSFLGFGRRPSGTQSYDNNSVAVDAPTVDTTGDSAPYVAPKTPDASNAPTAQLDAIEMAKRKPITGTNTFLSLFGYTSGKSVARRTLMGK